MCPFRRNVPLSVETITTFFSERKSVPSVEIERFRRKFKLMRAHLPGRVLGTSSPLDARLTVLVAAIFAIFVLNIGDEFLSSLWH